MVRASSSRSGCVPGRGPAPAADLEAARALLWELTTACREGAESDDPRITALALTVVAYHGTDLRRRSAISSPEAR